MRTVRKVFLCEQLIDQLRNAYLLRNLIERLIFG